MIWNRFSGQATWLTSCASRNVGAPKICRNDSFQKENKFVEVHHSPSFSKRFMLQCLQLCQLSVSAIYFDLLQQLLSSHFHGNMVKVTSRMVCKKTETQAQVCDTRACSRYQENLYLHSKTCWICMKLFLPEARIPKIVHHGAFGSSCTGPPESRSWRFLLAGDIPLVTWYGETPSVFVSLLRDW